MPPPSLYDVAVHESAHAAIARRVNYSVLKIDLWVRGCDICFPLEEHELAAQYRRYPFVTTARVRDSVAVLLAGYTAQHAALAGTTDAQDIASWRWAWRRLPTRAGSWDRLEAQAATTVQCFLREPRVQEAMECLVTAALRHRVLEGARLARLLEPFVPVDVSAPSQDRRSPAPQPAPAVVAPPPPAPRPASAVVAPPPRKTYGFSTPVTGRAAEGLLIHPVYDWRTRFVPGMYGLIA